LWNFGMGMNGFRVYQLLIVIGYYGWTTMKWCSFLIWSHILRNVHHVLVFLTLVSHFEECSLSVSIFHFGLLMHFECYKEIWDQFT
jgi:hypothetical protein